MRYRNREFPDFQSVVAEVETQQTLVKNMIIHQYREKTVQAAPQSNDLKSEKSLCSPTFKISFL